MSAHNRIEFDPLICGGKPCIAGHRITVANIVVWYERMGKTPDEIADEHDLSLADIHADLAYYFDHREEIDRLLTEGDAFAEMLRQSSPSKVSQKLIQQVLTAEELRGHLEYLLQIPHLPLGLEESIRGIALPSVVIVRA